MKEKYTSPECEIVRFSSEDVITTSVTRVNDIQSVYEEFEMGDFK